jgi:hypothetical protein
VALPPVGGYPSASLRHPEVHGVFGRVKECHRSSDASRVDVIDKDVLNELLQAAFAAQLVLFCSQIEDMVAEAIRPLCEASDDVRLGGFFGPCSPMLRTSSSSLMVTSIAACRAAYEDKGGAFPKDGVEGALVKTRLKL